MKTFLLILLFSLSFSQTGKQYDVEYRCPRINHCREFQAVITTTPYSVYVFKKDSINIDLRITKTFFEKGIEYNEVKFDTLMNDTLYHIYTGWVVVVPEYKRIHIELRFPVTRQYYFTTYIFK